MTSRRHWLAGSAAALVWPWAAGEPARPSTDGPLVLANAVYPPMVNAAGHASGEGVDIDIAREALRRGGADWPIEIQFVPWKRVLSMLERGLADFTTTVNFSAERDKFLRWSTAYRAGKRYHFYTHKGAGLKLHELADLHGHHLALSAGFIYPQPVLDAVAGQIEFGRDVAGAVQLVERGRVEIVIVSALAGSWEIHQLGLADRLERQPLEYFNPEPTYMAFSRASPRVEAGLAAMNTGLTAMLRDGSIARIERHYVR